MTKDEALKMALEALDSDNPDIQLRAAIIIRGVLAQHDSVQAKPEPEQEPVAWLIVHKSTGERFLSTQPNNWDSMDWFKHPLYTTPPQREWVGLTDEQIEYYILHRLGGVATKKNLVNLIRLCESKLKEKNNA